MVESKRTPLFDAHLEHKGKMVDFSGWHLPVEYEGILKEHVRVRTTAGLFDVSHMGEILVEGPEAQALVQRLVTTDVNKQKPNQVAYSLMCHEHGGVIDDVLIYKFSAEKFLLVVNAANTAKDYAWVKSLEIPGAFVTDVSESYAQLALQGPHAEGILQELCPAELKELKLYWFVDQTVVAGKRALVSRTGYTGEEGFEIYLAPHDALPVWRAILAQGSSDIAPIGLGARDTLRFEAKLPLYGHEISDTISPLEAGLGTFVKFDKGDFVGREALLKQRGNGLARKLVEIEMTGRGIPRVGYPVHKQGQAIGQVTTGSFAPTLQKNVALALVQAEHSQEGEEVSVLIREKPIEAKIGRGVFYTPVYRRRTNK